MNVNLREKKSGKRVTLFLDYRVNGKRYQIYRCRVSSGQQGREKNSLLLAENIRMKRQLEIQSGESMGLMLRLGGTLISSNTSLRCLPRSLSSGERRSYTRKDLRTANVCHSKRLMQLRVERFPGSLCPNV